MYYLCEKYYKLITVQYYIVNCVCWTYEQIGLTDALSEQNSFVCRRLTVLRPTLVVWKTEAQRAKSQEDENHKEIKGDWEDKTRTPNLQIIKFIEEKKEWLKKSQ